ncbi:MAG: DUF892 family protein [Candidatus Zixiibacteriota bacterium]
MTLRNLSDVLVVLLRDLFSAEVQISCALVAMEKEASNAQLRLILKRHERETEEHLRRLEQIGAKIATDLSGNNCRAMEGLIADCKSILFSSKDRDVIDAGIIASLQQIEHYEIGSYGTARAFARLTGQNEIAELLTKTLNEEKATDQMLCKVAVMTINRQYLKSAVS